MRANNKLAVICFFSFSHIA